MFWKIRIFSRVISRRMEAEGKTVDEVLIDYPKLAVEEKVQIVERLGA